MVSILICHHSGKTKQATMVTASKSHPVSTPKLFCTMQWGSHRVAHWACKYTDPQDNPESVLHTKKEPNFTVLYMLPDFHTDSGAWNWCDSNGEANPAVAAREPSFSVTTLATAHTQRGKCSDFTMVFYKINLKKAPELLRFNLEK